ncbi:hypothetical protein RAH42_00050 [Pyramidobacter sp. YE332]|uniref:hypothetical protein n=1 Tax=Pyramidobacter sp. YE332 TaxID=3068894 RepID=UPI00294B6DEA|nr:hypothetical protein [Pyramidobacter sp. YE332]WOL40051.1 hypothetical protein RAH42_00050 [Pyramidobacter sp. YE332]
MQKVLQKGYDDLRELYRGRENTAEAEIWRKKNARYQAVMGGSCSSRSIRGLTSLLR